MYIFIIRQTLTSDTTVMHTHPPLQICEDDGKMAPECQVGMEANTGKRGTYTYVASNNINFRDRGGRRREREGGLTPPCRAGTSSRRCNEARIACTKLPSRSEAAPRHHIYPILTTSSLAKNYNQHAKGNAQQNKLYISCSRFSWHFNL